MMYQTDTKNCYTTVGGLNVTNGNHHEMIAYENISYRYINDTRLAAITGAGHSYSVNYDALGRAAVRVLDGSTTYFIYDGEKPILEYRTWSGPSAKNVYGKDIDEILLRTDASVNNGQPFFYQDDHEGSITHLTNASGNVIERYTYDAFGAPTILSALNTQLSTSVYGNRFLFTGREYVSSFGIYEYRNRAYHPGLGRFMSEDPKLFVRRAGLGKESDKWSFGTHPDEGEFNLFRYCGNDPVDYTDAMGLAIDYDPNLPSDWQQQARGWVERVRQADPATVRQLEKSENHHMITKLAPDPKNPLTPGKTIPNNNKNATNGVGTGTTIKLDPSRAPFSTTVKDGKIVPTPGSVVAGHELGHAADADKGKAIPMTPEQRSKMSPGDFDKHPSERNAIDVENKVRDFEGLDHRADPSPQKKPGVPATQGQ